MEVYYSIVKFMWGYHLEVDYDKLKMYTVNPEKTILTNK